MVKQFGNGICQILPGFHSIAFVMQPPTHFVLEKLAPLRSVLC